MKKIFIIFLLIINACFADLTDSQQDFFNVLESWQKNCFYLKKQVPVFMNYYGSIGYFAMPSARMQNEGEAAMSVSSVFPYYIVNAKIQLYSILDLFFNYLIFRDSKDSLLSPKGYGNDAERMMNFKLGIIKSSWFSYSFIPDISFGMDDYMGTKRFLSSYAVATWQLWKYMSEFSIGYGTGRKKGFFGAFLISPFLQTGFAPLKNLSFCMEYDSNNYREWVHEHYLGKKANVPLNAGLLYQYEGLFCSVSSIRGKKIAGSLGLKLSFEKDLMLKSKDPSLPKRYVTSTFSNNHLHDQLQGQRFKVLDISNCADSCYVDIENPCYREEKELKRRIVASLGCYLAQNYEIRIFQQGIYVWKYVFSKKLIEEFRKGKISLETLVFLVKKQTVDCGNNKIFSKNLSQISQFHIWPKLTPYFGSSTGKFKYDLGLQGGFEGMLRSVMFELNGSLTFKSSQTEIKKQDTLNPSKLLQVRSDLLEYYHQSKWHLERAYLQKNFNIFPNHFLKFSLGYFELAYGGVAIEWLYQLSPIFSLGVESSLHKKRNYQGMGFSKYIIQNTDTSEIKRDSLRMQYFLDLYLNIPCISSNFQFSLGQFLANDKGIKILMQKTFLTGVSVGGWITYTNAKDVINQKRYFDKGVQLRIPFDFFMSKSSKKDVSYVIPFWLRDCGVRGKTGKGLYDVVRN